jgi:DNA end-binding protein Ku
MAPRANWKGTLKVGELSCAVALYTAASTSERIAFHTINRATGHRVRREFVDSETGKAVDREEQVKGYDVGKDDYVLLSPEEVAAAVPESDKTLSVTAFIACADVDDVYFDRPYYLAPSGDTAEEAFALIREGMRKKNVVAIAQAVLFRRVRSLLIQAYDDGLVATTLNFDYEVRSAKDAFSEIPAMKIEGEMLDLAQHIIKTKKGSFDAATFDDRYEAALADLVKAKLEGKKITAPKQPKRGDVIDLMAALRESAGVAGKATKQNKSAGQKKTSPQKGARKPAKAQPPQRKAG